MPALTSGSVSSISRRIAAGTLYLTRLREREKPGYLARHLLIHTLTLRLTVANKVKPHKMKMMPNGMGTGVKIIPMIISSIAKVVLAVR